MKQALLTCVTLIVAFVLPACSISVPGTRLAFRVPGTFLSCDKITDEALDAIAFDALDPDRMQEWIADNYHIDASDIQVDVYDDGGLTQAHWWEWEGKVYSASFFHEELRFITVRWESLQPRGDEILKCFGPPEFYGASFSQAPHGNSEFELELWYPGQGRVVRLVQFTGGDRPPMIRGNSAMMDMTLVRPGTVEEVVSAAYKGFPQGEAAALRSLQPWPGDWEDIVVTANRTDEP